MTRRVLKPVFGGLEPTRRGYVVLWALLAWTWFWFIAAMTVGADRRQGDSVARAAMALAVLGMVGFPVVLLGWRLPGIRRLYAAPCPMAIVSDAELELHIPSVGVRVYRWEDIGSLTPGRRGRGMLRSPTGEELVAIPSLILSGNWCSLAQMVASVRGDRYEAVRSWRFGSRLYFRCRDLAS
jgi:hypothetical protein